MQVYFINILNLVNILETNDYDNNVCNLCAKNKKYIVLYVLNISHSTIYTKEGRTCGSRKKI